MSDDLVERLRGYGDGNNDLMDAAADRIEKLEAALSHVYAWYPVSVSDPAQTIKDIRDFARNALEGKDD